MTEDFIHYIWQYKRFNVKSLFTTENVEIKIVKTGERNTDAGPDFCNAIICIGDTKWAGNVEIHLNSSDWLIHNHQHDKAYENVILHVVYNDDKPIYRNNGEQIPTLIIKGIYSEDIYNKYISFLNNKLWIPCLNLFKQADKFIIDAWLFRLFAERMERKALQIIQTLDVNKNNIEEAFYCHIARNFGFGVNAEPFEMLARSLPLMLLSKHKHDLFQTEALLYGQAGFLNKSFKDDYPNLLKKEYDFLRKKYSLTAIDGSMWKFLRLRPSNFPTIRIAQFADLIHKSSGLFSKIIESNTIHSILNHFELTCSEYWKNHYNFDKPAIYKEKIFGEGAKELLLINTVVPFLFVYGILKNDDIYKDRAISFMEKTKPEENTIIKKWREVGIEVKNASQTQALIELKKNYCNSFKCLQCGIGNQLLKN
jgi:hypothetical protein